MNHDISIKTTIELNLTEVTGLLAARRLLESVNAILRNGTARIEDIEEAWNNEFTADLEWSKELGDKISKDLLYIGGALKP